MTPRFPYHVSVAAMARSFEQMVKHDVNPPLPPPKSIAVVPSMSSSSTTSSVSTASSTVSLGHSDSLGSDGEFAALLLTVWMHMNMQLAALLLVHSSSFLPPATVTPLSLLDDDMPCLNELIDRHTRPPVASLWHAHEQAGHAERIRMGPSRRTTRRAHKQEPSSHLPHQAEPSTVPTADNIVQEKSKPQHHAMTKLAQDVLAYLNQCSHETSPELQALAPRLQGYAISS